MLSSAVGRWKKFLIWEVFLRSWLAFDAAVIEMDSLNVADIERAVNSHDSPPNRPKFVPILYFILLQMGKK